MKFLIAARRNATASTELVQLRGMLDAIVVGGGISGAVAAGRLRTAGRSVVLLEARPAPPSGGAPRPPGVAPRPDPDTKHLCSNARYSARWADGMVTIEAQMDLPTPGYEVRFVGRQSLADDVARDGLRVDELEAPSPVVSAFAATTRSTVAIVSELNAQIAALEAELADHFEKHPDADIYLSLPGIGVILGARVLGEFGDDPNRYADAKSRKNYAGTSPITRASGTRHVAIARFIRNRRLADAIDQWAFCSLSTSPGARAYYDHQRDKGLSHHKALRALGNRLVGILHGCLHHHNTYDEHTAWAHRPENNLTTETIQDAA